MKKAQYLALDKGKLKILGNDIVGIFVFLLFSWYHQHKDYDAVWVSKRLPNMNAVITFPTCLFI